MHTARIPPVDPAPAAITAVLAMHAGHICVYPVSASRSRTSALTSLRYRFAQPHMPPSGAMIVLPSLINEYSTVMAFDRVTRLAIKPADSRLRRVLVSMRCDTLPSWRRNCRDKACRLARTNTLGVHLPIKMDEAVLDPCVVFMPLFLLRKRLCEITALICLSRLCFAVSTVTACQFLHSKRN